MSAPTNAPLKVGQVMPDFALPDLNGRLTSPSDYRGRKLLLFMWASWWVCRYQLPGWQQLYQVHRRDNFEILTIAVDSLGAIAVRPWHEKAGASFTTVVDQENTLSARHGFKVIPNGLLVDEESVLRFARFGGFNVADPETVELVKAFVADPASIGAVPSPPPEAAAPVASDWERHFKRGVMLSGQDQIEEAAAEFREALLLDPDNWTVRKQLWRLLHPEKFGEQIDLAWQAEQRKREAELGLDQANLPKHGSG